MKRLIFLYLSILLIPITTGFAQVETINSYDISNVNMDKIKSFHLAEDGQAVVIVYTNPDRKAFVWHNGKNYGPMPEYSFMGSQDKILSTDGNDFYVKYVNMQNKEIYFTKEGASELKDKFSEKAFFNDKGDFCNAFIDKRELYINNFGTVKGPIDSANYIGDFHRFDDGSFAVSYRNESGVYLFLDGEVKGPYDKGVSINTFRFHKNKLVSYHKGSERGDYYYIIGENQYGPLRMGSEHITFSNNGENWGFIYRNKNSEGFAKINGKDFGPFEKFDFASDITFINEDPENFAFFYFLRDEKALFLKRSGEAPQKINTESMRLSIPVLSSDGKVFRIYESKPSGQYIHINEKVYGPFETVRRSFHGDKLYSKLEEFKFKKHGKAFFQVKDKVLGPFTSLRYNKKGDFLYYAYIDEDVEKLEVKKTPVSDIADIKGFAEDSDFVYSTSMLKKDLSFKIPFGWNSINIYEKTRLFPGVMFYKNDLNYQQFFEELTENKKLNLKADNKVILVSPQGKINSGLDIKKDYAQKQIDQIENISTIVKPKEITHNGNKIVISKLKTTDSAENPVYANLSWHIMDGELLYLAVYQTDEPKEDFGEVEKKILESVSIKSASQ
jgi:hypothetical protein